MPEQKRRRRWPIVLAIVAALVPISALVARHFTRPEALTAFLIDNARSQLGAVLVVSNAGRFAFVPEFHLVLPDPSLAASERGAPFLTAKNADVVVPWSMLWSGRYEIRRIELVSPRLDLDALDAWLASRPAAKTPDIRFALHASDATVVSGGKTIASGVELEFANAGDLAEWLDKRATLLPPIAGTAKAAVIEVGGARLEGVSVESRDDAAKP
ncbi:MAG TPA: hypothetical protein VKB52_02740 [Rhodanobacteraceae bacterium]|nr:hypothetical protein [Rhodanobacteraceae bacterium]